MDVRDHTEQYLVGHPGFKQLQLLSPETDGDFLLLAYWESETDFEQWTETDDFEAAHDELPEAMFLDPAYLDRYESVETITDP